MRWRPLRLRQFPDATTFAYRTQPMAPRRCELGAGGGLVGKAWPAGLRPTFDTMVRFDASALAPTVTWGITPGQGNRAIDEGRADPEQLEPNGAPLGRAALPLLWTSPRGTAMGRSTCGCLLIGSCTNGRLSGSGAPCGRGRGRTSGQRNQGPFVGCWALSRWPARLSEGSIRSPPRRFEWRETGLLDVSGHESGPPSKAAQISAKLQQPQRSRVARLGRWPHPVDEPGDGGRRGRSWSTHRCARGLLLAPANPEPAPNRSQRFPESVCCPHPSISMDHFHYLPPRSRPAHPPRSPRRLPLRSDPPVRGRRRLISGDDIDTDAFIPARFSSASASRAWGEQAFADDLLSWRAHSLIGLSAWEARILLCERKFRAGGSSRETCPPKSLLRWGDPAWWARALLEIFWHCLALGFPPAGQP